MIAGRWAVFAYEAQAMSRTSESIGIERDTATFHEAINKNQAVCISETPLIHTPTLRDGQVPLHFIDE